jgi:putative redox protein
MSHVTVRLAGGGYTVEASSRRHTWSADIPRVEGGADLAPTPEEELLGALGACTAMTLQMYALRKGWPLEGVSVEITHAYSAEAGSGPKVDRIERHVQVAGPLDTDQLNRLLEIANKCPVHRILTHRPVVITALTAGGQAETSNRSAS